MRSIFSGLHRRDGNPRQSGGSAACRSAGRAAQAALTIYRTSFLSLLLGACAPTTGGDAASTSPRALPASIATSGMSVTAPATSGDLADMPMWAYGITTLPQPGDTAKPQPWGRWFDPAIDRDEQLKPVMH